MLSITCVCQCTTHFIAKLTPFFRVDQVDIGGLRDLANFLLEIALKV
jgi:hypothetical protein